MGELLLLLGAGVLALYAVEYVSSEHVYSMDDVVNSLKHRAVLNKAVGTVDWYRPNQSMVSDPNSPAFIAPEYYEWYKKIDFTNRYGNVFIEPQLDPYITHARRSPTVQGGGYRTDHKVTDNFINYQKTTPFMDHKNDSYPTNAFKV